MPDIRTRKAEIRAKYRAERLEIPRQLRAEYDRAILSRIVALPEYKNAEVVLLFYPLDGEINLIPLMDDASTHGKRFAFPLCEKSSDGSPYMTFRYVSSVCELERGFYGLQQPSADAQMYIPDMYIPAVCFVPALSFDANGYRIGYGKGYYDRYLADFYGVSVGVIYSRLLCRSLPRGRFDRAVDYVVSETQTRRFGTD